MIRYFIFTASLFLLILFAAAYSSLFSLSKENSISLNKDWVVRWGDSPRGSSGKFQWLKEKSGWTPFSLPGQPEGRNENSYIWQRTTLPSVTLRDPAVYLFSVDTRFEAYLGTEKIYSYGNVDDPKAGFPGWKSHIISLPDNFAGKDLTLRVYSAYYEIGIYGDTQLGERGNIYRHIFLSDIDRIILSFLFLLLGSAIVLMNILFRGSLGWFSLGMGNILAFVWITTFAEIKNLLYDNPLFWDQIGITSSYFLAYFLLRFISMYVSGWRKTLVYRMSLFQLAISVGAGVGSYFIPIHMLTLSFIDGLALFYLVTIIILVWNEAASGNREKVALLIGLSVFLVSLIYDLLDDFGLPIWTRGISHWGFLVLMGSAGSMLFFHVRRLHEKMFIVDFELNMAKKIYNALNPGYLPALSGMELALSISPQQELGGDFFDFHEKDNGVTFLIGDVSGHGLSASIQSAISRVNFSHSIDAASDPGVLLELMNKRMHDNFGGGFATASCIYLVSNTSTYRYASAGHPPVIHYRAEEDDFILVNAKGIPLTMSSDSLYETYEGALKEGDILLMYTDGLIEAKIAGSMLQEDGLGKLLKENRKFSALEIKERILEYIRTPSEQEDDIALLVMKKVSSD